MKLWTTLQKIISAGLPAAFLQGDIYNSNWTKESQMEYLNYASLGFTVGHEITHGFDSTGYLFDAHGNFMNWWTNETKKMFEDKFACFVNQYGNFTDSLSGLNVNGTNTLNENIADNGELTTQNIFKNSRICAFRRLKTFLPKLQQVFGEQRAGAETSKVGFHAEANILGRQRSDLVCALW